MENKYVYIVLLFFGFCHGVSKAAECTARGRFPNDESADCRGYTMCLLGGLTNFTQYKLMCPMGSVYSHLEEQCTNASNYKCLPNFNCSGAGNFADPESTDCSSYVVCIEGLSNISTARVVGCPTNMLFNQTAGVCVNNTVFSCPIPKVNRGVINVDDPPTATDFDKVPGEPANSAVITKISISLISSFILLLTMST